MKTYIERQKNFEYEKFEDEITSTHCSDCDIIFEPDAEECTKCGNELTNETILENEECTHCKCSFGPWANDAWLNAEKGTYICSDCVNKLDDCEENNTEEGDKHNNTSVNSDDTEKEVQISPNDISKKVEEYKKQYEDKGKFYISGSFSENKLTIHSFKPNEGDLNINSEEAKHALKYILDLATLLNANEINVFIPEEIYGMDNVFSKYGFFSHCISYSDRETGHVSYGIRSVYSRTKYSTKFTYRISTDKKTEIQGLISF